MEKEEKVAPAQIKPVSAVGVSTVRLAINYFSKIYL